MKNKSKKKAVGVPRVVRHYPNRWNVDGRWDVYKEDGCIYDTKKAEDIPQWLFGFRNKLMRRIQNEQF
jgi:hypothetical protein